MTSHATDCKVTTSLPHCAKWLSYGVLQGADMPKFYWLVLVLIAPGSAYGQKVAPAKAFGVREDIQQISLSPAGDRVAYLASSGSRGSTLYIVDLDGAAVPKAVLRADGDPEKIYGCNWVSETRLICNAGVVKRDGDYIRGLTRLFAVNADGSELKRVSLRQGIYAEYNANFGGSVIDLLPGSNGEVLVGRQYVPEGRLGAIVEKRNEGYGVDRVDTLSLAAKRVVRPMFNANEFISDGIGNVRIMGSVFEATGGYSETKTRYSFRAMNSENWVPLSVFDWNTEQGFNPYAVDPKENAVYGFDRLNGRQAVFKVALDGSMKRTLVFSRPDVDVDGLVRIGRQLRVVGVSFATERRNVVYFDAELLKLAIQLGKALPQAGTIDFVDTNADETKMIIHVGADVAPGQYYHFNKKTMQLSELFPERPELTDYRLAPVKPIQYRATDGTMIPGYLTLPPGSSGKKLPAIVMPHGGPSARDEWGFDWLVQFYANRGFAVLQPNFRGSSGYGDAWFRNMGFKAWNVAIGDVTDAGRWLVSEGIADPDKLSVVGWSYGGYAALQSGVVAPDLFKAIIAIAPVTDLASLKTQSLSYSNYRAVQAFVGSGSHIEAGSPAQRADAFRAPVLMFHGDLDQNVSIFQSRMMQGKLKSAGKRNELIEFPGLGHSLSDSVVREQMLSRSDAFLRSAMGM
jgi:dipeptidyl aminopeptidase/acylaminoacyl peptidase